MRRYLVTAGNTREMIDRVRDWGNVFTGQTGRRIAEALAASAEVELLTSNEAHAREISTGGLAGRVAVETFRSHADLLALLDRRMTAGAGEGYAGVFMTAAVADYAPRRVFAVVSREPSGGAPGEERWVVRDVQADKVKSTHASIAVLGERTEKLVDLFRGQWGYAGLLVKFKLEVGIDEAELARVAEASRVASGADYIVANTLEMVSGPRAGAWVLGAGGFRERVDRASLPGRLAQLAGESGGA